MKLEDLLDRRPWAVRLAEAKAKAVDPRETPTRRFVWKALVKALEEEKTT